MTESTALSVLDRIADPQAFILGMGTKYAESGMFGCKSPAQGVVLMMHCMMERISPLKIMGRYHFIDGKLRMKSAAMLAEFNRAGGKHRWLADGADGKSASIELIYDGQKIVSTFTIEDANRQGLVKAGSAWVKTPANMLRWRAASNGVDMLLPSASTEGSGLDESDNPSDGNVIDAEFTVAATATNGEDTPAAGETVGKRGPGRPKKTTEAPPAAEAPTGGADQPQPTTIAKAVGSDTVPFAAVASGITPAVPLAEVVPAIPPLVAKILELKAKLLSIKPMVLPKGETAEIPFETLWQRWLTAQKVPSGPTDAERLKLIGEKPQTDFANFIATTIKAVEMKAAKEAASAAAAAGK